MVSAKIIDKLLPQTQCGECGFNGCLPYAESLAQDQAPLNLCPPGGEKLVYDLAVLLNKDPIPHLAKAKANQRPPQLAMIKEAECIGCTKCIQACPVDAIVGQAKSMHSVIADECTGCGLCVEPCPVDCIDLQTLTQINYNPEKARARYNARKIRQIRAKTRNNKSPDKINQQVKKDYIMAAVNRVFNKKHESK